MTCASDTGFATALLNVCLVDIEPYTGHPAADGGAHHTVLYQDTCYFVISGINVIGPLDFQSGDHVLTRSQTASETIRKITN